MGFLSKLLYSEVIEISDGRATSAKGKHPKRMLSDINDVCGEARIDRGEIYFSGNGKLSFSASFPESIHQALRNVIVNHLQ